MRRAFSFPQFLVFPFKVMALEVASDATSGVGHSLRSETAALRVRRHLPCTTHPAVPPQSLPLLPQESRVQRATTPAVPPKAVLCSHVLPPRHPVRTSVRYTHPPSKPAQSAGDCSPPSPIDARQSVSATIRLGATEHRPVLATPLEYLRKSFPVQP